MTDNQPEPEKEIADDVELGKDIEDKPELELETPADSYYGIQLRKYLEHSPKDGYHQMKQALMNDALLKFVFGVFLMIVGFGALFTVSFGSIRADADLPTEWLTPVHVSLNIVATSLSFLAVMERMLVYGYYNRVPAAMIDQAIAMNKLDIYDYFIIPAIFCQFMGVTTAVCLLFGTPSVWVALGPSIAAVANMGSLHNLYDKSMCALGFYPAPKKMDAIADEETDDKEDEAGDDKAEEEEKEPEAETADADTKDEAEDKEKDGQQTNIIEIEQDSEKVQQE